MAAPLVQAARVALILGAWLPSLLATSAAASSLRAAARVVRRHGEGCAKLTNEGSHFSVDVSVGTPGQTFSVVADTGSNALIIPSCQCTERGHCKQARRCFKGTDRSSTFEVVRSKEDAGRPMSKMLTFGSGKVKAVVARDTASLGNVSVHMRDGLLLMVDEHLSFSSKVHFEGIMGLGPPWPLQKPSLPSGRRKGLLLAQVDEDADVPRTSSFFRQAGMSRFSMCFGPGDSGALRFGGEAPRGVPVHRSVGAYHWGLDFRGVSVGGAGSSASGPVRAQFCTGGQPSDGQETPCALIPDSGTTLMLGPKRHMARLLATICDTWERCASKYEARKKEGELDDDDDGREEQLALSNKALTLKSVLQDCDAWLEKSPKGVDELPQLSFHLAGPEEGTEHELTFTAADYVLKKAAHGDKPGGCVAAFGNTEYITERHGPVWIVGVPLFRAYTVAYDADGPSVAFVSTKDQPCGSCDSAGAERPSVGLLASSATVRPRRAPHELRGEPRMPTIDLEGEL